MRFTMKIERGMGNVVRRWDPALRRTAGGIWRMAVLAATKADYGSQEGLAQWYIQNNSLEFWEGPEPWPQEMRLTHTFPSPEGIAWTAPTFCEWGDEVCVLAGQNVRWKRLNFSATPDQRLVVVGREAELFSEEACSSLEVLPFFPPIRLKGYGALRDPFLLQACASWLCAAVGGFRWGSLPDVMAWVPSMLDEGASMSLIAEDSRALFNQIERPFAFHASDSWWLGFSVWPEHTPLDIYPYDIPILRSKGPLGPYRLWGKANVGCYGLQFAHGSERGAAGWVWTKPEAREGTFDLLPGMTPGVLLNDYTVKLS